MRKLPENPLPGFVQDCLSDQSGRIYQATKELNPETYERMSEEFMLSLESTVEMYEDFDLVIDARDDYHFASAAVTGRALGEERVSEKVSYGLKALSSTQPEPRKRNQRNRFSWK